MQWSGTFLIWPRKSVGNPRNACYAQSTSDATETSNMDRLSHICSIFEPKRISWSFLFSLLEIKQHLWRKIRMTFHQPQLWFVRKLSIHLWCVGVKPKAGSFVGRFLCQIWSKAFEISRVQRGIITVFNFVTRTTLIYFWQTQRDRY